MNDHERIQMDIPAYVASRLEPEAARRLEAHLEECEDCADIVGSWSDVAEGLRAGGRDLLEGHPDPSALQDYAAGRMRQGREAIKRHLESCATCQLEAAAAAQDDRATIVRKPAWMIGSPRFYVPASLAAGLVVGLLLGIPLRTSPTTGTRSSPLATVPAWSQPVNLLLLERPLRGAAKPVVFRIPANQPVIPLAVPVVVPEGAGPSELYRFELRDGASRTVWSSEARAALLREQMAASGVVSFLVPAADLKTGSYALRFVDTRETPEHPAMLEIPFEIAR